MTHQVRRHSKPAANPRAGVVDDDRITAEARSGLEDLAIYSIYAVHQLGLHGDVCRNLVTSCS
jgi:hypothetical protein